METSRSIRTVVYCLLVSSFSIVGSIASFAQESPSTSQPDDLPELPQDFDPTGQWKLKFTDQALGASVYAGRSEPVNGEPFVASDLLDSENIADLTSVDDLQITYNPSSRQATFTGGGGPDQPVTMDISPTGIGTDGQFEAPGVEVAPGCQEVPGFFEEVLFLGSSRMIFFRVFTERFVETNPGDCRQALLDLGEAIRLGRGGNFWMPLAESKALDLDSIAELQQAAIAFAYEGTKN